MSIHYVRLLLPCGGEYRVGVLEAAPLVNYPEVLDVYKKSVLFSKLIHLIDWRFNYH